MKYHWAQVTVKFWLQLNFKQPISVLSFQGTNNSLIHWHKASRHRYKLSLIIVLQAWLQVSLDGRVSFDKWLFYHPGYQLIKVHLVFDVKHDGRHTARMVADGHLIQVILNSIYAEVVSLLCGLWFYLFFGELNEMEAYAMDIGNVYLEFVTTKGYPLREAPNLVLLLIIS